MTRSRSPAQSEKTPSAFVVLSPTLSEVAVAKSFTFRNSFEIMILAVASRRICNTTRRQDGKNYQSWPLEKSFRFLRTKKIEFKIVFLYVAIHFNYKRKYDEIRKYHVICADSHLDQRVALFCYRGTLGVWIF